MNFVKRNKGIVIAIGIFFVALLVLIQLKNVFSPDDKKAIYGNRLEGIEKVKITNEKKEEVVSALEGTVSDVNVRVVGRLINVIITANDDISVATAKGYADTVITKFSDAEKEYYDFQIFIEKKNDAADFPIIGYRHHAKGYFSWTKDRTGTV